ncbi:hypothetical protein L2D08_12745 [Domibacillus sp. PGB-M46]|uniref:hypothetical protein n=1 Tax=Domibacillus sp. PGB-M46 TaxID=2910255 RepID=UPI001F58E9E7|nr:hypothetical protein [Domibacillus sp. PGB-M46]MCI2255235.1 hypothetical protein [Domibacillus sp. PGB-M46]
MRHGYSVRILVRNPRKTNEQNSSIDVLEGTVEKKGYNQNAVKRLSGSHQYIWSAAEGSIVVQQFNKTNSSDHE